MPGTGTTSHITLQHEFDSLLQVPHTPFFLTRRNRNNHRKFWPTLILCMEGTTPSTPSAVVSRSSTCAKITTNAATFCALFPSIDLSWGHAIVPNCSKTLIPLRVKAPTRIVSMETCVPPVHGSPFHFAVVNAMWPDSNQKPERALASQHMRGLRILQDLWTRPAPLGNIEH